MNAPGPTVFIVDDDPSVGRSLSRLVRQEGMEAQSYSSAEDFLRAQTGPTAHPSCLVVDLKMPGLSGLELQRRLSSQGLPYPAIFISGHGDIPATVLAMKQGAVTFLPKPFDRGDLLAAIAEALEKHQVLLASSSKTRVVEQHMNRLTEREREVMSWVITGALNKQIAERLGIVEQTVKVHRARVMEKMRVASVAELVRDCALGGVEAAV